MSDQSNKVPVPVDPTANSTILPADPAAAAAAAAKKKADNTPPTPKGGGRIRGTVTQELMKKEYVEPAKKQADLSNAIWHATKKYNFLGTVLQCLNISYVHTIPTAGVMFNNDMKRWDLLINPHFFCNKLNDPQRVAVLIHELYHITHKHPFRAPFMKLAPRKRMIMNIAADMAINQYINDLPAGCQQCPPIESGQPCTNEKCPGRCIDIAMYKDKDPKTGVETPWERKRTMEFYYEKLIELFKDSDKDDDGDGEGEGDGGGKGSKGKAGGRGYGKGPGMTDTIDEHIWDGSAEEKDMLDATEELVKRAMIKERLSYDNLPGAIKELLQEINVRRAELDYRRLINSAIKRHASGHTRKSTWTRVSRRFGINAPGTKTGDLPKLHFFIDTSGSISVEEANEFLDICDNFLKAGSRKCRLNLFHTDNYYGEEYRLGHRLKREDIQSGGTDLTASMKDIHKRQPDLAIFLTDGYYGDVQVEQWMKAAEKFPQCLFIISKQGSVDHPLKRLGETIKIPAGK
jgi:predicted metal-dependent peptidase